MRITRPNTKMQSEQIAAPLAAYAARASVAKLADIDLHFLTVVDHLHRYGVTIRQWLLEGVASEQVMTGYLLE